MRTRAGGVGSGELWSRERESAGAMEVAGAGGGQVQPPAEDALQEQGVAELAQRKPLLCAEFSCITAAGPKVAERCLEEHGWDLQVGAAPGGPGAPREKAGAGRARRFHIRTRRGRTFHQAAAIRHAPLPRAGLGREGGPRSVKGVPSLGRKAPVYHGLPRQPVKGPSTGPP